MLVWVTHLTASMLRYVWDDLHAAWNYTLRTAVADSVGRGCRSTEAIGKLLDQCASDIVRGYMHSVSDSENDE